MPSYVLQFSTFGYLQRLTIWEHADRSVLFAHPVRELGKRSRCWTLRGTHGISHTYDCCLSYLGSALEGEGGFQSTSYGANRDKLVYTTYSDKYVSSLRDPRW